VTEDVPGRARAALGTAPPFQPAATEPARAPEPDACPNCGSAGLRRYCPECGQGAPGPADYSLRTYAAELAGQVTNTDGKIARTLWALVARPGLMTADHLEGRRARYLRPLQLFLLVNVLLFIAAPQVPLFSYSLEKYLRYAPPSPALVASHVQRATPGGHAHDPGADGTAFRAYEKSFDARVEAQRKSLVILFAPALALVLRMLFARRRRVPGVPARYGEHLVFALHALAFIWLMLAGVGLLSAMGGKMLVVTRVRGVVILGAILLLLLWVPVYALRAVRRVYRLSWPWTAAATAVMAAAFLGLLVMYRGLLFFTTYYTL
jgi:hypothetical protein